MAGAILRPVPENEIKLTFARSSGAGGQNVNKTSTKVVARWRVGASRVFLSAEKERLRAKLTNRLNSADELLVTSETERSQAQNRAAAVARLQSLVSHALRVPQKRRSTRPTKSSKMKRLETKKQRSRLKQTRGSWGDWL